jgi:hypothetical protein
MEDPVQMRFASSRDRHRQLTGSVAATALAALLLVPGTALAAPGDVQLAFASDATWTVDDADGSIGPVLSLPAAAQHVCLNDTYPDPCPAGATIYGWAGAGWGADLTTIPGAGWIWAPGIAGDTEPADEDAYRFSKTLVLPGTPVSGTVSLAADDGAEVLVNGVSAGTSASPGSLASFDITGLLQEGSNTIVVVARNGLICNATCPYSSNPAGVVFGGAITYRPTSQPSPTLPPTSTVTPPAEGTPAGSSWLLLMGGLVGGLVALAMVPTGDRRRRTR